MDCSVHNSCMARVREFDETQVVEAAMQVFWQLGFEATSLPALLESTNLSRSSLYQAFGSKEALFERCVKAYADKLVSELRAELDATESPTAFVRSVFLSVANESDKRRGCLVMNTANELGQRDPRFAKLISLQISRFESVFEDALRRAIEVGELADDRDVRALARYLVCALSGLRTMSKAGMSRAALRSSAEIILQALD